MDQTETKVKIEKGLSKSLHKLDKNLNESDDENPYASSESEPDIPVKADPEEGIKRQSQEKLEFRESSRESTPFQAMKSSSPLAMLEALKKGGKKGNRSPMGTVKSSKSPNGSPGQAKSPGYVSSSQIKSMAGKPSPGKATSPLQSQVRTPSYVPGSNTKSPMYTSNIQTKSPAFSSGVQSKSTAYVTGGQAKSPLNPAGGAVQSPYGTKEKPVQRAQSPLSTHVVTARSPTGGEGTFKIKLKVSGVSNSASPAQQEGDLKRKRPEQADTKKVLTTLLLLLIICRLNRFLLLSNTLHYHLHPFPRRLPCHPLKQMTKV